MSQAPRRDIREFSKKKLYAIAVGQTREAETHKAAAVYASRLLSAAIIRLATSAATTPQEIYESLQKELEIEHTDTEGSAGQADPEIPAAG